MKSSFSVGGRPKKNDPRRLDNYVGTISITAEGGWDPFILAAIYRGLFGDTKGKGLRTAINAEAERCRRDHLKQVEQKGGAA